MATPEDALAIAGIYAPIVSSSAISFEVDPPSTDEMRRRIKETLSGFPWLVCRTDDEVIGYAYGHEFAARPAYAWSVETSIYIAAKARGLGVGGRLYGGLLTILREQGFRQAFAGIALPNPASIALHESAGFTSAGLYRRVGWKFGTWHDVGWWQLPLEADSETGPRQRPVPFSQLGKLKSSLA